MVAVALELGQRLTEGARRRRRRDALRDGPVPGGYRAGGVRRVVLLSLLLVLAAPASAPAALKIGIAENKPSLFADPLFTDLGVKYVRVVVSYDVMTSGDDELPARDRLPRRRAGAEDRAAGDLRARARRGGGVQPAQEPAQAPVPAPVRAPVRAPLQAVPHALPARAHVRAVERDQPLHAADLPQPEGGRAVHPDRAPQLPRLPDRGRRHPRPRRQGARQEAALPLDAALHQALPQGAEGAAALLRAAQLLRHQPLPRPRARSRSSRRSAAARSG